MTELPARLPLALLPTPLERLDRLSEAWGGPTIWAKRDDLTGFELSGNKVRKLEFHLAAARETGADTVVTCGAAQSNHCRATALAAARVGLRAMLVLRTADGAPPPELTGNHLLDRLAGAEIRFVTPEGYAERDAIMQDLADELATRGRRAWVIPEGGSDALGMWGFVLAMRELADQLAHITGPIAAVWHPASSGGTTAGMGWGAHRLALEMPIVGCSVGDPAGQVERLVEDIWAQAAERWHASVPQPAWRVTDDYVGGGYGMASAEELRIQAEATGLTGMIFDPTYTGKALYGLRREIDRGRFGAGDHVVFWHTGGGFAAFAHDWSAVVAG